MGALFPGEGEEEVGGGEIGYGIVAIIFGFFLVPKLGWLLGILASLFWPFYLIIIFIKWLF